jgi:two-component system, cell cycle sensor histidine kinase and response regulator CckA
MNKKIQESKEIRELQECLNEIQDRMLESEEHGRTILQTAMDGYWRMGVHGEILEVNEAYCRMSGYTARELTGMHIKDLEAIETPDEVDKHGHRIKEKFEDRFETKHRRKDGTIFDVEISAQFRPAEGGQYVSFIRDITERQRMDRALRDSRELIRAAFMCSPNPISISTLGSGICLDVNQASLDMFGYTREEVVEKRVMEKNIWADPGDRQKILDALDEDGYVKNMEVMLRRKDGSLITASVSVGLITMLGARHLCIIAEDITERKKAEAEKARLTALLQQAQKMEAVGRLAGGVAHEFNNMLSVILGYTELLLMDRTSHNQAAMNTMKKIRDAAARSTGLTRQLLAFASRQDVNPEVINLNDVIENILSMLQRLIGEDITVTWLPDGNLRRIKIDPSQIDQIMTNLCVNARDSIKGVGKVLIKTGSALIEKEFCVNHPEFKPGDYVLLTVSDDGSGMDLKKLDTLFEPFFTADDREDGAGLGLAMVYGIVKQNNGFITVESQPGSSTTFNVYLPVHNAGDATETDETQSLLKGSETILLVEDDEALLNMEKMRLQSLGYNVLAAALAGDAIKLASEYKESIHLLFTDVVMPDMNGKELAKELKSFHTEMKCVFMSGYASDTVLRHGILEEGVNFIRKPYTINELASKIREVLDRQA